MKFEVDIEKLISNTITIQDYLFLQIVYYQNAEILYKYKGTVAEFYNKNSIDFLMSIDLLKLIDEAKGITLVNLAVTDKFIDTFLEEELKFKVSKSKDTGEGVEDWIDEWYNMFPRGVRSGQYPVKSGKKGCIIKLNKFVKENPEYTKDIIMEATKDYVDYCRLNNYKFMQLAHYFVSKNGTSTLAANCEIIVSKREGGESEENDNKFSKSLN